MTQLLTAIAPPAEILNALTSMQTLLYDATGSTKPTVEVPGEGLYWVRQKPTVSLSGNNPKGPRDVTLKWFGFDDVSVVLYPMATGLGNSGLWDPKNETGFP